jgi:hypothetical protein
LDLLNYLGTVYQHVPMPCPARQYDVKVGYLLDNYLGGGINRFSVTVVKECIFV